MDHPDLRGYLDARDPRDLLECRESRERWVYLAWTGVLVDRDLKDQRVNLDLMAFRELLAVPDCRA